MLNLSIAAYDPEQTSARIRSRHLLDQTARRPFRYYSADKALTDLSVVYNRAVMQRFGYTSQPSNLDAVFAALADPTRRAILSRLAAGEASVNEIAAPFEISQPAVSRHLKVLEQAGLIERDIDKQRRPARLKAKPMAAAVSWLEEFRQFWSSSFDQLDGLLEELKKTGKKGRRG